MDPMVLRKRASARPNSTAPMSAMAADAAALHESFTALVNAGFTTDQALRLVEAMLIASITQTRPDK